MENDALTCRRETRRRRILENSENRMRKITGRSDDLSNVTSDNDEGSLLTQNGTSSRQVTNGPVQLSACAGYTTASRGDSCNLEHPDTLSSTSEISKHVETLISTSWNNNYLYAAKLHLICLAVLVRIMFLLNYDFMFGQSLVAPFCVVEVTDLLLMQLKKPHISPPGLLGAALLVSGISVEKVMLISKCIHMLTKVWHDICIYFFTFVTFHAMLAWQENTENNS